MCGRESVIALPAGAGDDEVHCASGAGGRGGIYQESCCGVSHILVSSYAEQTCSVDAAMVGNKAQGELGKNILLV